MVTVDEVGHHGSRKSCWVIIAGQAYDVTDYVDRHPGGASSILRYAGKASLPTRSIHFVLTMDQDATAEYEPIHPPGTIENSLPRDKHVGKVTGIAPSHASHHTRDITKQAPLSVLQNLEEFEVEANKYLSEKARIYFSSAADSLTSHKNNVRDWDRVVLRPMVMR